VVDDGSTDKTKEIVREQMRKDERIRYIYQKNSGPATARNKGIQASKGKYIAFLDSDDIWFLDKLEKQMDFLISHPGFVVYGGARYLWEEQGGFVESEDTKTFKNFDTIQENLEYILFHPNLTITSAILLEKSILDAEGFFDVSLSCSEDDNLYMRLAMRHKFFALHDPVFYRRRHKNNVTKNLTLKNINVNRFRAVHKFVDKAPQELLPSPKSHILSYWSFVFSREFFENAKYMNSLNWFLKGFFISPGYYSALLGKKIKKVF
jgi:glycosyltransferase involved in cell wall biosynthesis